MKKMSQNTWEIWFLGSILGCVMPMMAVMCESRDPQVMKYATIALVVSFISFMGSVIVGTKNDTKL
jgi:uncharacterized membrane protein YjfL (UPF0719 family)